MAKNNPTSSQSAGQPLKSKNNPKDQGAIDSQSVTFDEGAAKSPKPEVKKDLSSLPKWNCRVEGTPADQQWTVGEVFHLVCEGPTAEFLSTELTFKQEKMSPFQLRVLEVEKQTDNALEMLVTTYLPAPAQFKELYILDQGEEVVLVEPFNLVAKSVIQDPKQKPYGPQGPVSLSYPVYLWGILGVVVVVGLVYGLFKINRRAQMRKVIEELKLHNTALGAFNQFNKDLRALGRMYIFGDKKGWSDDKKARYVESLDQIFRMYLLREFIVPALDWNSGLVLKTVSKQDKKRFPQYEERLRRLLKEFDRAKADTHKLQVHDCKQLTQMSKRVTQLIWKARR